MSAPRPDQAPQSAPAAPAGPCGHGPDPHRTTLRPEVAAAVKDIREQVGRRMRELRERAELPYLTKAQVRAAAVSGMDLVEIEVRIPAIALHNQADRERRGRITAVCKELAVEFDELLGAKQTNPPYFARTTIIDWQTDHGVN